MVTTLNEGCKPHLTKSGLHIIIHKYHNKTKNEMLNCTVVGTPYMVCYAHFRFNGVSIGYIYLWLNIAYMHVFDFLTDIVTATTFS